MTGARERDAAEDRRTGGAGVRERDDVEAAAEAREPARTEPSGAPVPAKARPAQGGPTATDPVATAGAVAADPVAVADPVAPAPGTPASPASGPVPSADDDSGGTARPLLARAERDELGDRLHRATGRFVDDPPGAVDDACAVLGDLGERVAALLAERRGTCRDLSRRARGAEGAENAETERLRLALRDYRDLAERLLKL
ncbi:hypothetical protein GCM10010400_05500 [Streptomyces aculeolatus]|uniref:hypothetical protein n=1 Tax=Streptomyces aculeolatus TaxID=270689 RepID=UPI001CED32CF|nr:hypothetical protein [Streptomyces aculeolatus]